MSEQAVPTQAATSQAQQAPSRWWMGLVVVLLGLAVSVLLRRPGKTACTQDASGPQAEVD